MYVRAILWDLEDDPRGNVAHVGEHGLIPDEVDSVLLDPNSDFGTSRSSGHYAAWGWTKTGRHIMVVFELSEPDVVYPITAFEVEP